MSEETFVKSSFLGALCFLTYFLKAVVIIIIFCYYYYYLIIGKVCACNIPSTVDS
ncbi:MAG: hypothetical protein F6K14_23380 [Symploca sp. SIO2C1]|nr:hypothetical protein [Symploca sp. SIO2C1]